MRIQRFSTFTIKSRLRQSVALGYVLSFNGEGAQGVVLAGGETL